MSRWAALPAELDPRVRQLVVRLRRLKDHSGLSLRRLAARTGYSQKSWERYLGGRSLPPRAAVEALARAVDEDPTRLLALHEVAAEAWRGARADATEPEPEPPEREPESPEREPESPEREPESPEPEPESPEPEPESPEPEPESPEPESPERTAEQVAAPVMAPEFLSVEVNGARSPGRSLRVALVAGAVALVLALSTAVLAVVRLSGDGRAQPTAPLVATGIPSSPAAPAPRPPSAAASPSAPAYTCRLAQVGGRWYAGISRTGDAILAGGHAGPDVAEAQCLLRRAGFSPGGIDGIFGPVTERAVEQVQRRAGLVVDGIVGPHTWKALRG
ncbi:peptidoglycan-binding protein [Streptomyces sp. Y7]|uniref:peptidoglycan-binding protein n=1 Tax=Streptomyces sp. Y7 TaxID=3342392 RepID=UPI003718DD9C